MFNGSDFYVVYALDVAPRKASRVQRIGDSAGGEAPRYGDRRVTIATCLAGVEGTQIK